MKRIILLITCVATCVGLSATNKVSLANSKVINRIRAARKSAHVPAGGYVTKPHDGGKVIAVCNQQQTYTEAELITACSDLRRIMKCPVYVKTEGMKTIGLEITLKDKFDDNFAQNMIVAPEEGRAKLSVARLIQDNPNSQVRLVRLRKEIIRAALMSMGMGISETQPCILRRVRTLSNLDATVERFSPTTQNIYDEMSEVYGLEKTVVKSYRTACEEGWAPAPTNDIQKAIWDKVHQLPTKPIKINPETKPVKE